MDNGVSHGGCGGGVELMIPGIGAAGSFGSPVSTLFTDSPADRAGWMATASLAMPPVGAIAVLDEPK